MALPQPAVDAAPDNRGMNLPPPAALPLSTPPDSTAQRLAYAGLLPLVSGALLVWAVHDEVQAYVALALSAYAAVLLSFLGGIHWGFAMRQPQLHPQLQQQPPSHPQPQPQSQLQSQPQAQPPPRQATALLVWGVVPSLVAWPAALMPPRGGLVILGLMLVVCYAVDRRLYPAQGAAAWLTLRFRLSAVAALSCFLGAAGT